MPTSSPPRKALRIEPGVVWKTWRNTAIVVFVLGVLLVCSPVLVPIAAATRARHRRRVLRAARDLRCSGCGQALGDASIPLAEELWQGELDDYARRNPGVKFNFPRPYDAACPRCRIRYAFVAANGTFNAVSSTL